ncbi:MAG: efflux transporter outer membrane subunit [Proteobacteria bacterium]|nr:efflux transporter outer membrane subunit [Pseudomonadota bacterium]
MLGLTSLTLGCTSLETQYEAPLVDIPNSWVNADTNQIYQNHPESITHLEWWTFFEDPTLISLIEEALQSNPDMGIAQNRILQAEEKLISAGADKNPTLDANLKTSKATSSSESSVGRTSSTMTTQFQTSWEIDFFGKFKRNIEASEANLRLKIATRNGIKTKLIASVAESYIAFRSKQEEISLGQETVHYLIQLVELAKLEVTVGLETEEQLQLAQMQLATLKTTLSEKTSRLKEISLAIDLLLGAQPGDVFTTLTQSANLLQLPSTIALSIPADTILQRPDIQEALHQLQIETANVGVAEAQRYPSFSFSGSIGLEALTLNSLGNAGANFSSIQASLLAPIFNSGALDANVNAQVASREAALETYKKTVANGLTETEQALVNLASVKQQLQNLNIALDAGANHLELINQRYQTGLVSFREVLQSRDELNSLKQKQSTLTFNEFQSITQLYKVLGGGWAYNDDEAKI